MLSRLRLFAFALLLVSFAILVAAQEVTVDSDTFSGLSARPIGPAVMGGRIADITAVQEGQRLTIYIGSAGGGVWKSSDGGTTFKPVFDKQSTQSIGSLAIDPSNPQTVWVGTGEAWVRNSVSVGTGIYRSRDGGDNWENLGLTDSEHLSRIVIHPKDGNTVYACALGHLWNANQERGVFKTTDGGKTWKKILYRDENTGCAEMVMDPQDPNVLYAAMWDVRRQPFNFRSGGPGSGLFKSTDGGATWHELRKGLPEGDLGRIGLAIPASKNTRVYAVVEAKNHTALYRSDDAGESWTEVNNSFNISGRPFYFARVIADPNNPDRVYKPGFVLTVSEDGGKSFSSAMSMSEGPATACTAITTRCGSIPPTPIKCLTGNDGGVYQSLDRANHWRFLNSLPVSQFYHVSVDMADPYNVYGGLQDNGTWMAPIARRRWHCQSPLAQHRLRRRLLGVLRSQRFRLRLRRIPGRQDLALSQVHRRSARTSSRCRAPTSRSSASTGILRFTSARTLRARSISAASFCSARATTANPGSASRPISPPTIPRSSTRSIPAA